MFGRLLPLPKVTVAAEGTPNWQSYVRLLNLGPLYYASQNHVPQGGLIWLAVSPGGGRIIVRPNGMIKQYCRFLANKSAACVTSLFRRLPDCPRKATGSGWTVVCAGPSRSPHLDACLSSVP
jgi:hypothetical protein